MVSFRGPDPGGTPSTERIYLTRDGSRLVPESDPDAFMLAAAEGATIPRHMLDRLGKGPADATAMPAQPAEATEMRAKSDVADEPAQRDDLSAASAEDEPDTKSRRAGVRDKAVRNPPEDK